MHCRLTRFLLVLWLGSLLTGCGFIAAPIAGTAATAAQLTVKGGDQGIHYSKQAAQASAEFGKNAARASLSLGKDAVGGVAAAANTVADAATNVAKAAVAAVRPASIEEANALQAPRTPR